jgi:hypothetical protein
MPKQRRTSNLSPDRAAQAVSILVHEGKLRVQDLARALERREKMVSELRARLASLGESSGNGRRRGRRKKRARQTRPRKAAKRISKRQRAARQAQGRYLGAIRRLSKADRAKIKAIREKSGVRAAIAAANKMAKG